MGTIKILGFDEDGNAQRLKIRIARFLDYDPVTASDKSNIRSTLGITSQGGLGDLLAANNLDDVASLDTTKANLEIPDVGTAPDETPLNQHLGSLAYQSADSVSIASAEVDTLEVTGDATVDGTVYMAANKALNMGGASQLYYNSSTSGLQFTGSAGNNTVFIQASDGKVGIGKTPGTMLDVMETGDSVKADFTNNVDANFRIKTSGANTQIGPSTASNLELQTQNSTRWTVHSSNGNLIASSGVGIDFGSGASTTIDDYEEGTWTPVYGPSSGSFATMTMAVQSAKYVKVGSLVHLECYIRTDNVDTTGGSGTLKITGLPFTAAGYAGVSIDYAKQWVNSPISGFVVGSALQLQYRSTTTGSTENSPVSDLTTGSSAAKNQLIFSVTYKA